MGFFLLRIRVLTSVLLSILCRLDQILGRQGSKSKDVYESKICLASRVVKVERQVIGYSGERERRKGRRE